MMASYYTYEAIGTRHLIDGRHWWPIHRPCLVLIDEMTLDRH